MPAIWLLGGGKAPDKVSQWGKPPGIYNIVDDDPAPVHDWLPALASMVGAKPPLHVPGWLTRLVAGEHLAIMMTQVRSGSNTKARQELGWRPAHRSWRQGVAEVVRSLKPG